MQQGSKNIVVCGYPKSGTNWVCRLTAELLDAPFVGDWGFDTHNRSSINLEKTHSPYRVYKSHHVYEDLDRKTIWKLIYLVRDPRDVVVSGAHFFEIPVYLKDPANRIIARVGQTISQVISPKKALSKKIDRMIHAVLHGDPKITPWLGQSWLNHYRSFPPNQFRLFYESLIADPETTARELLDHLETELTPNSLRSSIEKQSFAQRKREAAMEHPNMQKLVRKGTTGQYKTHLNSTQLERMSPLMLDPTNPYKT